MNFIAELRWRKMLSSITPEVEEQLASGEIHTAYVGFDPTAPSLTIGNLVALMLLVHWQRAGGKPIVLLGGATGRIGDPSGKNAERNLMDFDQLDANLAHQAKQFERYLDFTGSNAAVIVNNHDIYKDMNVLEFLRDVGKRLTINYMLAKDSVKNRLESGLSFTEFSYQLLQGYDFQYLYRHHGCNLQMGGSDQWGNIMSGVELTRRNLSASVHALTAPLLTKPDGTKYGKSEAGNVWLDPALTSPYQFYQFCLNSEDAAIKKLLYTFSFKNQIELDDILSQHADAPHLRLAQRAFADELTARVHSEAALAAAKRASEVVFSKKADILLNLTESDWEILAAELTVYQLQISETGINIIDALVAQTQIRASNGEARRDLKGNAISVNRQKISGDTFVINTEIAFFNRFVLVEIGKNTQCILELTAVASA